MEGSGLQQLLQCHTFGGLAVRHTANQRRGRPFWLDPHVLFVKVGPLGPWVEVGGFISLSSSPPLCPSVCSGVLCATVCLSGPP